MKRYAVVLSPRAEADLERLADHISDASSVRIALAYVREIRRYCESFETFPHRGTRDEQGTRQVGYRRQVTIRFDITRDAVEIVTISYRGRRLD